MWNIEMEVEENTGYEERQELKEECSGAIDLGSGVEGIFGLWVWGTGV